MPLLRFTALVIWAIIATSACSSHNSEMESAMHSGSVVGRVTIGPMCPGPEIAGRPCDPPPELYAQHYVALLAPDSGAIVLKASTDSKGFYKMEAPAGTYLVDFLPHNIAIQPYVPQAVTVIAAQTVQHDIHIDTGMR